MTALYAQVAAMILTIAGAALILFALPVLWTHWRVSRRARRRIGWYS